MSAASRHPSPFSQIPAAPPDPILGLTDAFNAESNPKKVNLGVGVYQNEQGKVPLLEVVRKAEHRWEQEETTKSYLPIDGVPAYDKAIQKLMLGENSPLIADGKVVTVQGLGGTGSLKVGADFLKRFFPKSQLWISNPSWENHRALFEAAGFQVEVYPYYNADTRGLDFTGLKASLEGAPEGTIILLHACCHNPTGADLRESQWGELVTIFTNRNLIPFLDFAYQGFGAGVVEDAFAIRAFADAGLPCLIANSFSKSFSLYRERVGALTLITASASETKSALSQLKRVIRTNYSSPPSHGAQVVSLVLNDSDLRAQWQHELAEMRERILKMRKLMVQKLSALGQDFSFLERQRGMFSYTGLPLEAVRKLRAEFGIYIVDSGRICVAALNEHNIDYVCESISQVLSTS